MDEDSEPDLDLYQERLMWDRYRAVHRRHPDPADPDYPGPPETDVD